MAMIKYKITLEHDDFVLLLGVLKRAQGEGLITWNATTLICENTKVEEQELWLKYWKKPLSRLKAKTTAFNYYTMTLYGVRMLAIIVTIVIGTTGKHVVHIAPMFMGATF